MFNSTCCSGIPRAALLQPEPAGALFAGHQEQEPQLQHGWFADALCLRQIAWQGQGAQLAARAETARSPSTFARTGPTGPSWTANGCPRCAPGAMSSASAQLGLLLPS